MDHLSTARPQTLSAMIAQGASAAERGPASGAPGTQIASARPGASPQTAQASGTDAAETLQRSTKATQGSVIPESEGEFTFDDFVDVLNPLHHLPGVGTAYRAATDDQISDHAKAMGGVVFGGPLGILASGLDAAIREESGKDVGEHMVAAVFGEDAVGDGTAPDASTTAVAEATPDEAGTALKGAATQGTNAAAGEAQAAADLPPALRAAITPGNGPLFLNHPGFVAGPESAANVQVQAQAQAQAQTQVQPQAQTSETRGAGDVRTGRDALAAFARDMRGVAGAAANDRAEAAGAATGTAARETGPEQRTQQARANAGPDSEHNFMPLRRQDYNHQTSETAQLRRLQQIEARANSTPDPRVDPQTAALREAPDVNAGARADGAEPQGIAGSDDMNASIAERMKEALDKYRRMNANE